jgi:site-specific DNA-methyltransferase (adenine-specific)
MCAIEDVGFDIRDCICHIFGSGFPKSHNLKGAWNGWGTALKPAAEFWTLARKPFKGTVADNVLEHGTGGINVDATRVGTDTERGDHYNGKSPLGGSKIFKGLNMKSTWNVKPGRWPTNLVFSHHPECGDDCHPDCPVRELGEQSGELRARGNINPTKRRKSNGVFAMHGCTYGIGPDGPIDSGSKGTAARFFPCFKYQAKASKSERNEGLDTRDPEKVNDGRQTPIDNPYQRGETPRRNIHPTVKPVELMRWLVRLVTPPGGVVLDPFLGSGTTGIACVLEGFDFIGIEQSQEYIEIAKARIEYAQKNHEGQEVLPL